MRGRPPLAAAGEERTSVCIAARLTPSEVRCLDDIAKEGGLTRSEAVRSMLRAIFDDDRRAHEVTA